MGHEVCPGILGKDFLNALLALWFQVYMSSRSEADFESEICDQSSLQVMCPCIQSWVETCYEYLVTDSSVVLRPWWYLQGCPCLVCRFGGYGVRKRNEGRMGKRLIIKGITVPVKL